MNGKLIAGISFIALEVIIVASIILVNLIDKINISKEVYTMVFGGILLLSLNILAITLVILGTDGKRREEGNTY